VHAIDVKFGPPSENYLSPWVSQAGYGAVYEPCTLPQVFSNYGSRLHLGSRKKLAWQIRYKSFCKLYKKFKSRPAM